MSVYQESYLLPSKGLLYENVPAEVAVRNMTTAEEKMLLGSNNDKALDNVIGACIVDKKFELSELVSPDKHFILLKLRILSYGSEYWVKYRCPACGTMSEFKIDLDKLEIFYLPDDFVEPYDEFKLPVSGDEIALKIPRMSDISDAVSRAKRFHKKFPESVGDISYIYRMMYNIHSVNGKENMRFSDLQDFVEGLHARDSSYIKSRIDKLKLGYDTEIMEECPVPGCGEDIIFELPFTSEFFRARFKD